MSSRVTIIVGSHWGDEGKGKICDLLAAEDNVDAVAKANGGANAGHTVKKGDQIYIFHLLPSGALNPGTKMIIGSGVVIDPEALLAELEFLEKSNIHYQGRIFIDQRAHLVLTTEKLWEEQLEKVLRIGTTRRGIGQAYACQDLRVGIQIGALLNPDQLAQQFAMHRAFFRKIFTAYRIKFNFQKLWKDLLNYREQLAEFICDTLPIIDNILDNDGKIIIEGAQGPLLDRNWGTYPFCTSSGTTSGGLLLGVGRWPKKCEVVGVMKAYTTRVGHGPLPTELGNEETMANDPLSSKVTTREQIKAVNGDEFCLGKIMRVNGGEFGASTGRPRRCGWLDLVAASYAAAINRVDYWAVTKLDVLNTFEQIKVCVAYENKQSGKQTNNYLPTDLENWQPVYVTLQGWLDNLSKYEERSDLPIPCREFLNLIEEKTKRSVKIISVGQERDQTIFVN